MLLRILPGFLIAIGLGIMFSLHGESPDEVIGKWTVETAFVKSNPKPETPLPNIFPFNAESRIASVEFVDAAALSPSSAALRVLDRHDLYENADAANQVAEVAAATVWRQENIASTHGLASVGGVCGEETSAWIPTARYPEPYIRGIETWTSATSYGGQQKGRGFFDENIYKHDGSVFSFGVRQDWSVDSVFGLSVDILDAKIKARYDYDYRKNDITAYFANAHYRGTFLGKYPVDMKATYGRVYHTGSGEFRNRPDTFLTNPWNEDRHRSHYYAFSAKAGLPLLFGGVIKVLPEIGVEYKQLRTTEYTVNPSLNKNEADDEIFPAMRSKSLQAPVSVTVKRDYKQCWGLVTPKIKVSYSREFDDSASGVYALHSTAASRPYYDDANDLGDRLQRPLFNPSQKYFGEIAVGLDVQTVGGWKLAAEYSRHWAKKYGRNEFKLELGRCF